MTTKDYSKPQWFLIYTKPRQEERAKENLENQGFETFLPMIAYEKIKQPKLYSLKPLFPRYLFTKFNIEKNNWVHIKSTRGVSHVITFGDKLTEVPDSVVDFLKTKVDDHNVIKLKVTRPVFQKGDKLVIKKGVFQGKEAKFLSMTGKERVRVLLKLMNKLIITEVPGHDVGRKAIIETFQL